MQRSDPELLYVLRFRLKKTSKRTYSEAPRSCGASLFFVSWILEPTMHDDLTGRGNPTPTPSPSSDSTFTVRPVRLTDFPILIAMYIACFAEAPWREEFTYEVVLADFAHILAMKQHAFLVVCEGETVIGAAIGFPVAEKPKVQADLPPEDHGSFYVAEIFVDRLQRNRLLSLAVTTQLLAAARALGFDRYSVRTSIDQPRIIRLFTDHFKATEVGRQEVTSMKNIDGTMQEMPDTRIIMSGPIR